MGSTKTPRVPDPANTYRKSIETNIKYAPQIAGAEQDLRTKYDGADIEGQLGRQEKYGGQAVDMYHDYLNQIDPQGQMIRSELGKAVSSDLKSGHKLGANLASEEDQGIRAAQTARGQTMGNAAVSAEGLNRGSAAQNLYQQRLQNAGAFLAGDTSVRDINSTAGLVTAATTPDRSFNYVNPLAGQQGQNAALGFYQAALAGGAAGGGANPWTQAAVSVGTAAASSAVSTGVSSLVKSFGKGGG